METTSKVGDREERIFGEGRAYRAGWYDDGDAESGPRGGSTPGIRLGQVRLEVTANGCLWLIGGPKGREPSVMRRLYDTGLGGNWQDVRARILRDAVEGYVRALLGLLRRHAQECFGASAVAAAPTVKE